jgi:hypothetical protein
VMLKIGLGQFAKLSCRWRYGSLLSAYLDNELTPLAKKAVAGHLQNCVRCRVEFEQMQFASRAMDELEIPVSRAQGSLGQVFQLPVRKVSPFKKLYGRKVAVPLPVAAGVIVALIGATLFAITSNERSAIQQTTSGTVPSFTAIKVVEVPVERVVTRVIYSKRSNKNVRGPRQKHEFVSSPPKSQRHIAQNAGQTAEWSDNTLKDFRPAASANLRLVKEQEK